MYNGSDCDKFGNILEHWRELLVHPEAPGSACNRPGCTINKSGSAGNRSGSTLNHSRAVWDNQYLYETAAGGAP